MHLHKNDLRAGHARRGAAALLSVLFLAMVLASFALSGLAITGRSLGGATAQRQQLASRYAAEAGLAQAIFALRNGMDAAQGAEDAAVDFGGSSYWVDAVPLDADRLAIVATGRQNHLETRIEAVLQVGAPGVPHPAIFALEGIRMDSNARVDSYDASIGTYESQATNHNGNSYARREGTIATNQSIVLSQNAAVWGNATPGPSGSVTIMGNATVSGATLPALEMLALDPIEPPATSSTGDNVVPVGGSRQLDAGAHGFDLLRLRSNSTMIVRGPATLVVEDFRLDSGSRFLADTTNGPVELYVASDFLLGSNTTVSPLNLQPTELAVFLSADNMSDADAEIDLDQTAFESNARLYGTVLAPHAFIDIDSNFQLFGSVAARRVHLDSNARVHFDEQLQEEGDPGDRAVDVLSWRIASRGVVQQHPQQ